MKKNVCVHMYMFTYCFPLGLLQDIDYSSPVLYSRTLLLTHSLYNSLVLLIANSQSPFPHESVLYVYESVSVSQITSFV